MITRIPLFVRAWLLTCLGMGVLVVVVMVVPNLIKWILAVIGVALMVTVVAVMFTDDPLGINRKDDDWSDL